MLSKSSKSIIYRLVGFTHNHLNTNNGKRQNIIHSRQEFCSQNGSDDFQSLGSPNKYPISIEGEVKRLVAWARQIGGVLEEGNQIPTNIWERVVSKLWY